MDSSVVVEITDKVSRFLENANKDEMTGRVFNLTQKVAKDDVEAMVELAIMVLFNEQNKECK